jgi:hypothetical protein
MAPRRSKRNPTPTFKKKALLVNKKRAPAEELTPKPLKRAKNPRTN